MLLTTPIAFLVGFVLVQQWEHSRQEHRRKRAQDAHLEACLRDDREREEYERAPR